MNKSRGQSLIITGIALIGLAFTLFYYSSTLPKVQTVSPNFNSDPYSETATTKVISNTYTTHNEDNHSDLDDDEEGFVYPINLNNCTIEELMSIDGIGEAKASAILEYREYIGEYTSVDEIKNIKGIGDKIFEKVSPYLCV